MPDIKISQLPVVPNNTFTTIFPNVQGGETNQIALSGFNTNDFSNVVNLGTGSTASVLTMDCSLGDVFVFTYTGTGSQTFTGMTTNAIEGKTYYLIGQHKSAVDNNFEIEDNNAFNNIIRLTQTNKWQVNSFFVLNGQIISVNSDNLPIITGSFPY